MARSFGRLFTSLWDDGDFRPLSIGAKLMYGFLISQADLEHSGIIGWRPSRWALDLGEPIEDVISWLKELDQARYLVIDEPHGEVLVRSLIRRDDIWKQPNVFKAAAASAKNSKSPQIKAALYHEVRRLDLTRTGRETQAIRDALLTLLEPFANRSPNPPEGFPRGSDDRSGGDVGSPAEPSWGGSLEGAGNGPGPGSVDNSARSGKSAGQNPSGTLSEDQANPSAGPQGKGSSYGPVVVVPHPHSPTPSPPASPEPVRGLWPAAVPDVQAEGEDSQDDETPELPDLVARVRAIRPDWATDSIERAMSGKSVRERPWPMACAAMLAVAADPASQHPGRVAHDGPWWQRVPSQRRDTRPPWCGECDELTRMLDMDTDEPRRCPKCKSPKARAS